MFYCLFSELVGKTTAAIHPRQAAYSRSIFQENIYQNCLGHDVHIFEQKPSRRSNLLCGGIGEHVHHSLCFLDRLRHGEEYAVDSDGQHHDVVEVLVGAEVHAGRADLEVHTRNNSSALRVGLLFHPVELCSKTEGAIKSPSAAKWRNSTFK